MNIYDIGLFFIDDSRRVAFRIDVKAFAGVANLTNVVSDHYQYFLILCYKHIANNKYEGTML